MPIWLVTLLGMALKAAAQAALPLAINILQKTGVITATEAWSVKTGTHVLTAVENIQTEDTYPPDKNTGQVTGNL